MTNKQLSRREAMKVLGTAIGGSALASLPPAWSKPALTSGSLPVHAQTSGCGNILTFSGSAAGYNAQSTSSFSIPQSDTGIPANTNASYTITIYGSGTINGQQFISVPLITSDGAGDLSSAIDGDPENFVPGDRLIFRFEWIGGSFCIDAIFT